MILIVNHHFSILISILFDDQLERRESDDLLNLPCFALIRGEAPGEVSTFSLVDTDSVGILSFSNQRMVIIQVRYDFTKKYHLTNRFMDTA